MDKINKALMIGANRGSKNKAAHAERHEPLCFKIFDSNRRWYFVEHELPRG
jgi:hypothetical protein